jgi:hypothetical protein
MPLKDARGPSTEANAHRRFDAAGGIRRFLSADDRAADLAVLWPRVIRFDPSAERMWPRPDGPPRTHGGFSLKAVSTKAQHSPLFDPPCRPPNWLSVRARRSNRIGRLYLREEAERFPRHRHISLVPEHRGQGWTGGAILRGRPLAQAGDSGRGVSIYVEKFNPARGFMPGSASGSSPTRGSTTCCRRRAA